MQGESDRAKQIATDQMQKMGYGRAAAFTPQARARNPYVPESERPQPLEASPPLVTDTLNLKPKTDRRSFGVGQGDQ
jgi:hypothetical protein